ncbi:MAG: ABC transporter ATP-binding protein [Eubacteriales bacterium]
MNRNTPSTEQKQGSFGGPRPGGPIGGLMHVEKPRNTKRTLLRLIGYLGKQKKTLAGVFLMVIVSSVLMLGSPILQKTTLDIVQKGLQSGAGIDFKALISLLALMGVLYVSSALVSLAQGLLSASLSLRTVQRMRSELFAKMQSLPVRFFDTHTHGELMSRMTNDVDNISNTFSQSITSLISGIITVVGSLLMMLYYSPLMALITLSVTPLGFIITKYILKRTRKHFSLQQSTLGELNGHIEEMTTGQKTVAAYGHQKRAAEQFREINLRLKEHGVKAQIYSGVVGPLMNVLSNLSYGLVAIAGGVLLIYGGNVENAVLSILIGNISIGTIQAFITLSRQFTRPINEIANQLNSIQSAISGAERVFDIMDESPEEDTGTAAISAEDIRGDVSFSHVNFGYKEGEPVLKDFTLDVASGQKIALVGPTGAGKTTVVNLLTRFYEISEGDITLDGIDIKQIPKDTLRSLIGIVLQDTVLFTGSVRDNIRYGKPDATDMEVEAAAKISNADAFITRLPEGYDTQLSESATNLSQGQRQLLAIARAVLADPKILILDEATSSVDTRTEMHIQQAMIALMKNRTSFIIAHRLSTIRDADIILVIDGGRINESGSHAQLLENDGLYARLYRNQYTRESEAV